MLFAAKCFWPGVGEVELRGALTAGDAFSNATFQGALFLPGDELVLCLVDAGSRAEVKSACEHAGWPCERVIESVWISARTDKGGVR
jgi:hypothetical protein